MHPADNSVEIKLTLQKTAFIDRDDWDTVKHIKWSTYQRNRNGYITCYALGRHGGKIWRMHRLITNCPDDMMVDHIDGNGLNNRRSNLRVVTQLENSNNMRLRITNKSNVSGVNKRDDRWIANWREDGKWKSKSFRFDNGQAMSSKAGPATMSSDEAYQAAVAFRRQKADELNCTNGARPRYTEDDTYNSLSLEEANNDDDDVADVSDDLVSRVIVSESE